VIQNIFWPDRRAAINLDADMEYDMDRLLLKFLSTLFFGCLLVTGLSANQGKLPNIVVIMQLEHTGNEKRWFQKNYTGTLGPVKPVALFDLQENPAEDESMNLVDDPEHKKRVLQMSNTYLHIRNAG
jgi:hypothetical protein